MTPEPFFVDLPEGKTKGFCEPVEGNPGDSLAISLEDDCRHCQVGSCHMFDSILGEGEAIKGRRFKKHNPKF